MDTTQSLDTGSFLKQITLTQPVAAALALLLSLFWPALSHATDETDIEAPQPQWAKQLEQSLRQIEQTQEGDLGVYVKDLTSGVTVSLRAEESWYLASGIKVPAAMAMLRNIEAGDLALDTQLHLLESDYVDGAGPTNWQRPGSALAIHYLLEQMLTVSDNTASDMIIRAVGLEHVNKLISELVPEGIGNVTSLADVRRHTYSGFHPDAFKLSGKDFLTLRQHDGGTRIKALADILQVDEEDFALQDLESAFTAYYATDLNSGSLSAFGDLLEALVSGQALKPASTDYLLNVLFNVKTGQGRIKAALPSGAAFAHKTGTQHRRACDLGVAMSQDEVDKRARLVTQRVTQPKRVHASFPASQVVVPPIDPPRVIVAVCSRGFPSTAAAESAIREVGKAIASSGVLAPILAYNTQGDRHETTHSM